MPKFDRYLLSQLLALFGFFSLLLVSVYWINRAVGLFDQLIGDGQSAWTFVEFSLLTLPNVIRLVLPISAFVASVYVANRLTNDSELVVMQATGFSSFRLARPVLYFGLITMVMMSILTHVLVPSSRTLLADRSAEITQNMTARYLRDGQFMHPTSGVTLYIGKLSETGELLDVFVADDRDPKLKKTYFARNALVAKGDAGPMIIMFDGTTENFDPQTKTLSLTRFEDATFDVGSLVSGDKREKRSMDEASTFELIRAPQSSIDELGASRAVMQAEGHSRFANPLLGVAAALIGFAALLLGAFSRFGLWRQIAVAVVLLIVVQTINTQGNSIAQRIDGAWAAVYLGPVTGIAIGIVLLWLSQRPRLIRRKGAAA